MPLHFSPALGRPKKPQEVQLPEAQGCFERSVDVQVKTSSEVCVRLPARSNHHSAGLGLVWDAICSTGFVARQDLSRELCLQRDGDVPQWLCLHADAKPSSAFVRGIPFRWVCGAEVPGIQVRARVRNCV